ncbi:helix-turn-helix domain-containing protein [Chloroflexota bacterium]
MRAQFRWIKHYESSGNLGVICQRCGISRPTKRKWLQQYEKDSLNGLVSKDKLESFGEVIQIIMKRPSFFAYSPNH